MNQNYKIGGVINNNIYQSPNGIEAYDRQVEVDYMENINGKQSVQPNIRSNNLLTNYGSSRGTTGRVLSPHLNNSIEFLENYQ